MNKKDALKNNIKNGQKTANENFKKEMNKRMADKVRAGYPWNK